MRANDLYITSRSHQHNFLKMTKARTVTFLMMIISTCALILSITDAYPTAEVAPESNVTDVEQNSNNDTRIVITHIVKTIEFEVGVVEDDGLDSDNTTDASTPQYIETDIKLLNVNLLRDLLDKADTQSTTRRPEKEELTPTDET